AALSLMFVTPPRTPPVPYTTLFRSPRRDRRPQSSLVRRAWCRTATAGKEYGARRPIRPGLRLLLARLRRPSVPLCRLSSSRSPRSEEHTSELQSPDHLVCRHLLAKK